MIVESSPRRVLQGQVAFITGAGRGIGRAIALDLAGEGATVVGSARTELEIQQVANECELLGSPALAMVLDVTDREACRRTVLSIEDRFGHIDILVNNAGMASAQKFLTTTDELWRQTMDVNLNGAFHLTQAALPAMLQRSAGTVIAISSIAGKIGQAYIAPYSAAKHALLGFMRSLAVEYADSGLTFNSICPAYVDTSMTEGAIQHIMRTTGRTYEDARLALLTPQHRLVGPEEVSAVCVLLASKAGRGINGQSINVDGGTLQW